MDSTERQNGRVLGLILRASMAVGNTSGVADLEKVARWARMGPRFTVVMGQLIERGLVEVVVAPLPGATLTPLARSVMQGVIGGQAR
jgi:hypothetical protein